MAVSNVVGLQSCQGVSLWKVSSQVLSCCRLVGFGSQQYASLGEFFNGRLCSEWSQTSSCRVWYAMALVSISTIGFDGKASYAVWWYWLCKIQDYTSSREILGLLYQIILSLHSIFIGLA